MSEGFIRNCYLRGRESDSGPLVTTTSDGEIIPRLDGYAIVPMEHYMSLLPIEERAKLERARAGIGANAVSSHS